MLLHRRLAIALSVLVLHPAAALAQPPTSAPGALFGSEPIVRRISTVDLTVSLSAANDDDLAADQEGSATQNQVEGRYAHANAFLSMTRIQRRYSMTGYASTLLRHYPQLNDFVGSNYTAGVDVAVSLGRRTSLRTGIDLNHVSAFAFDTFSRNAQVDQDRTSPEVLVDDAIGTQAASSLDWTRTSYGGWTSLGRQIGRRGTVSVAASARHTERVTMREETDEMAATALVGRTFGRDITLSATATSRHGIQRLRESETPFWTHELLGNIERQWRHSRNRRTIVTLSGGPSAMQQQLTELVTLPPPAVEPDPAAPQPEAPGPPPSPQIVPRVYSESLVRLIGGMSFAYYLNSTWHVQTAVRRGAGMGNGVYSTSASLDARGTIGRRVSLAIAGGYTDGEIGFGALRNRDETSFASGRVQFALGRFIAAYSEYFFYNYRFAATIGRSEALPARLDRRGFRVGLTLWAPLKRG